MVPSLMQGAHNKRVALGMIVIINLIALKTGVDEKYVMYSYKTFKKKFKNDKIFKNEEWEISRGVKNEDAKATGKRERWYLIQINGHRLLEVKEIVIGGQDNEDDNSRNLDIKILIKGNWINRLILLRNQIKNGRIRRSDNDYYKK